MVSWTRARGAGRSAAGCGAARSRSASSARRGRLRQFAASGARPRQSGRAASARSRMRRAFSRIIGLDGRRRGGCPRARSSAAGSPSASMPIYEYKCPNGHLFEVFHGMTEPSPRSARSAGPRRSSACCIRSRSTTRARASTRPTTAAAAGRARRTRARSDSSARRATPAAARTAARQLERRRLGRRRAPAAAPSTPGLERLSLSRVYWSGWPVRQPGP